MKWLNVIYPEAPSGFIACRGLPESGRPEKKNILHHYSINDIELEKKLNNFIWECDKEGIAAFVIPSVMPYKKAGKEDVTACQVILLDIDNGNINAKLGNAVQIMGEPSMIVNSGGITDEQNKVHAYWKLNEPATTPEELTMLSDVRLRLAHIVGSDKALRTLSQPIRVPGSVHHKGDPQPVEVVSITDKTVELSFIADRLASVDMTEEAEGGQEKATLAVKGVIRAGGVDGVTRFDAFSRFIGGSIKRFANREISLNKTWEEINSYNLKCIDPPWAKDRLEKEFNSLLRLHYSKPQNFTSPVLPELLAGPVTDDTPKEYQTDRSKEPINNIENARIALQGYQVRYDEFVHADEIILKQEFERVSDDTLLQITGEFQRSKGLSRISDVNVKKAIRIESIKNKYHPVSNFIDDCVKNYEPNEMLLDLFFPIIFGTEENDYTKKLARVLFISMIARVKEPGCKVDTVIILEGDQGIKKSTVWDYLACGWFTDHMPELDSKDALQQLLGKWLIEFSELTSIKKSDVESVKRFITTRIDTYRSPYDKITKDHPRQCIFVGSTNQTEYLTDATGNRRFLPVKCLKADVEAVKAMREIMISTAYMLYKKGEPWWVTDEWVAKAKEEQDKRFDCDAWEPSVLQYINEVPHGIGESRSWLPRDEPLAMVTTDEILHRALEVPIERRHSGTKRRVADILKRLNFIDKTIEKNGVRIRAYVKT